MHLEWAISWFQCGPASSACFFIFLSNLFRFGYLYTFFSTTQNQRVQINSVQIAQKEKINNIKHLLRLRLTKISLKVCNWQSFGEKLLWHSVQGENIIITFGCAFVQEKYLITEFMHVSSLCPNIIVVVAVCVCVVRLKKIWYFWTIWQNAFALSSSAFFDELMRKSKFHFSFSLVGASGSRLHFTVGRCKCCVAN